MIFPASAFERTGTSAAGGPSVRYECGICWTVYDPAAGDPVAQVPPGTSFAALPEHWTCPNCEAPRHKFIALDDV